MDSNYTLEVLPVSGKTVYLKTKDKFGSHSVKVEPSCPTTEDSYTVTNPVLNVTAITSTETVFSTSTVTVTSIQPTEVIKLTTTTTTINCQHVGQSQEIIKNDINNIFSKRKLLESIGLVSSATRNAVLRQFTSQKPQPVTPVPIPVEDNRLKVKITNFELPKQTNKVQDIKYEDEKENDNIDVIPLENIYVSNITRKFDDLNYTTVAAYHGIQFTRYGKLYAFTDEFIHFIKFDFPFENFRISSLHDINLCTEMISKITVSGNITEAENFVTTLNNTCQSFEQSMASFSEQIDMTATKTLKNFRLRQQSRGEIRNKRFIDPISVAVGAGAIWLVTEVISAKHDRKKLYDRVTDLEDSVEKTAKSLKIVAENFIGFSKEVSETMIKFNEKINLLKSYTTTEINNLYNSLNDYKDYLESKIIIVAIMSIFNDYRLAENNLFQNQLVVLLDGIQTFENIFSVINSGRLSHGLLSWRRLNRILSNIERSFNNNFDLGIHRSERQLYYTFPLISTAIDPKTNKIYISIRIPLTRKKSNRKYTIIKPTFLPFTCLKEDCFNKGSKNKTLSFINGDTLWLVNEDETDLMGTISPNFINCQYINHQYICFTFDVNQIMEAKSCYKGIFDWDERKIGQNCDIITRQLDDYQPIAIGGDRYVIHKNALPVYDLLCENKNPVRHHLTEFIEVINLDPGCDVSFPSIGRILRGPFARPLRNEVDNQAFSYHSELLTEIQKMSTISDEQVNSLIIPNITVPYIRQYNSTIDDVFFEWDTKTLTKFTNYLSTMQQNLAEAISEVETVTAKKTGSYFVKGLVGTFSGIIQVLMITIAIMGVLSYSRVIGSTACFQVIAMTEVEASIFGLDRELFSIDIQTIVDLTVIGLLVFILTLIVITTWRRRTVYTHSIGRIIETSSNNWTILVFIVKETPNICTYFVEVVELRVPVLIGQAGRQITDLRVANKVIPWHIKNGRRGKTLSLGEKVHIYDNNDSLIDGWQQIQIKISAIKWKYLPEMPHNRRPVFLNKINEHGVAFVNVAPKRL